MVSDFLVVCVFFFFWHIIFYAGMILDFLHLLLHYKMVRLCIMMRHLMYTDCVKMPAVIAFYRFTDSADSVHLYSTQVSVLIVCVVFTPKFTN